MDDDSIDAFGDAFSSASHDLTSSRTDANFFLFAIPHDLSTKLMRRLSGI